MGTEKNDADSRTEEETVGRTGAFSDPVGIGEKQKAVALAMIREKRPPEEILEREGVTAAEYADWIRDGAFPGYAASLARGFAEADAPYVWNTLLQEAKDGNVPAIRLYFDIWRQKQPASASRDGHDLRERNGFGDPAVENLRSELFGS